MLTKIESELKLSWFWVLRMILNKLPCPLKSIILCSECGYLRYVVDESKNNVKTAECLAHWKILLVITLLINLIKVISPILLKLKTLY